MSSATDLRFAFRAVQRDGTLATGELSAASREEASVALASRGLFPVALDEHRAEVDWRGSMRTRDLALGLRLLGTLLSASLPLERALLVFATVAPASWTPSALASLRESVREGRGLAAALGAAPLAVPPLVLGIIEAGEAGGALAESVRRAADVVERQAAHGDAMRAALAYPAILGVAGALSVALLVGVVLPRFAAIVADLGAALPASTRLVLGFAEAARTLAVPMLIVGIVAAVAVRWWLATSVGARVGLAERLLGLPVVGRIRLASSSARAGAAISALLAAGVPIAAALRHGARAAGNAALERRLASAREGVIAGERLSSALARTGAGSEGLIQLVRAGEATGELAPMLGHAARLDAEFAEARVRALVRLIEPSLILVFGAIVALVAAALLQAVYSVRPLG